MARVKLPYRVECKWPQNPFFEVIAAFDCEPAANAYRDECADAHSGVAKTLIYRVIDARKRTRT